jgi:rubrerythrin
MARLALNSQDIISENDKMDEKKRQDIKDDHKKDKVLECPFCGTRHLIWAADPNYRLCPHCGKTFLIK